MMYVNSKFEFCGKVFRPGEVVGAEQFGDELSKLIGIGYIFGAAEDAESSERDAEPEKPKDVKPRTRARK